MPGRVYNELFQIAADQFGLVTVAQARRSGIGSQTLLMMARRGALRRVSRGVYRLQNFPETELDVYMEAVLWPVTGTGVVSHESALVLFELSDVNPAQVHITVPDAYRSRRSPPRYLVVHRADLPESDMIGFRGLPVTSPFRTIRDCGRAAVGAAIIEQATVDAEAKGLITGAEALQLREVTSL